ncbi:hypothetical protein RJG79_09090 [Mycoplasmatota bacterium WC44]
MKKLSTSILLKRPIFFMLLISLVILSGCSDRKTLSCTHSDGSVFIMVYNEDEVISGETGIEKESSKESIDLLNAQLKYNNQTVEYWIDSMKSIKISQDYTCIIE